MYIESGWDVKNVILGSWERGENYVKDIIEGLNHWSTGWIDWNLALDPSGGPNWAENQADSPIIVNAVSKKYPFKDKFILFFFFHRHRMNFICNLLTLH